MQKKYIIRNVYGGSYTTVRDQYYPFIDPADPSNIQMYDSEQEAINDIDQYMRTQIPLIELVPIYTI